MARPPSPVIAARNQEIYSLFTKGASVGELAKRFNLTPQRIGQVIAAENPEENEDYDRSLYRGYLWRLFEEVRELYRNPGYKMSPTGKPATDLDGEAAVDTNIQLQAGELELKILESLRKMDARDRPVLQRHSHEFYENQAAADIARRLAERDRQVAEDEKRRRELEAMERRILKGEVVREIEPPQSEAS